MADSTAVATNDTPQPQGGIATWPARVREYIDDLRAEMRKVTWPSRKQVQATTLVVIATVFVFAFYFALVDIVISRAVVRLFDTFVK